MAVARALAFVLLLSACSELATPVSTGGLAGPLLVDNQGGTLEGHTPRGFAGMGTGLFIGDNLNPSFPDGDGVQVYLTFELPSRLTSVTAATLASDALVVRGSPFADLGPLIAEVVEYEAFGPALFDLGAVAGPAPCVRIGETGIECDLSDAVRSSLGDGVTVIQIRLRLELAGDGDGQADLAMFFRTDSNTNEPGLFTLTLEP